MGLGSLRGVPSGVRAFCLLCVSLVAGWSLGIQHRPRSWASSWCRGVCRWSPGLGRSVPFVVCDWAGFVASLAAFWFLGSLGALVQFVGSMPLVLPGHSGRVGLPVHHGIQLNHADRSDSLGVDPCLWTRFSRRLLRPSITWFHQLPSGRSLRACSGDGPQLGVGIGVGRFVGFIVGWGRPGAWCAVGSHGPTGGRGACCLRALGGWRCEAGLVRRVPCLANSDSVWSQVAVSLL